MSSDITPKKPGLAVPLFLVGIGVAGLLAVNIREQFFLNPLEKDLQQAQTLLANSFQKNKQLDAELKMLSDKNKEISKKLKADGKRTEALEAQIKKQADALEGLSRTQMKRGNPKVRTAAKKKFSKTEKGYRPDYQPIRGGEAGGPYDSAVSQRALPPSASAAVTQKQSLPAVPKEASEGLSEKETEGKAPVDTLHEMEKALGGIPEEAPAKSLEKGTPEKTAEDKMEASVAPEKIPVLLETKKENAPAEYQNQQSAYYYNLGVAYTQGGLYKKAAEMYEKAITVNPSDAAAHFNLGIIYDDYLGKTDKGIAHYEAFLEASKDPEKKEIVAEWIVISKARKRNSGDSFYDSAKKAFSTIALTNAR